MSAPIDSGAGSAAAVPPRRKKRRHHRAHRTSSVSTGAMKNEINVTPLVDVVLVLLIIFMVVTPMLSRGVNVDLPQTSHHERKPDTGEQVVVSISYDGKVFVGGDATDSDHMVETLRAEMRKTPGTGPKEVHVKADRRLTYVDVRKVLERIHEAGAQGVALGTDDLKKEGQ